MLYKFKAHALKATAWALLFCLVAQEPLHAAPALDAFRTQSSPADISKEPVFFEAPLDFALLKEVHKGANGRLIIHIQDAHSNLSGQMNLAQALDKIMAQYGVSLVLSEGGSGDCSLTPVKKIASQETWKRVAKNHLVQGKISGEEYLNLVSEHRMKILGLEDMPLYFESVQNYAALADKRSEILTYLDSIESGLNKVKNRIYPASLVEYERKKGADADYKALLELAVSEKVDLGSFPYVEKLISLQLKEKLINFGLANLEQAALIEELGKSGPGIDLAEQLKKAAGMKGSKNSQLAYFQNTFRIAREKNILLTKYPNLLAYGEYLKEFSELDLDKLIQEMEKAEDKVYVSLLASEDSRLIRSMGRYLGLLKNAYRIQMTTDEFKSFMANEKDFTTEAFLAFLNRQLSEQGYFEAMVPYRPLLEEGRRSLEAFYASVTQRDFAFVKNAEKAMQEEKESVAVLISGGYHTPHLKKLFMEKGYSIVVLTPIVTSETNQKKYEELLLSSVRKEVKSVQTVSGEGRLRSKASIDGVRVELAVAEATTGSGARLMGIVQAATNDPKVAEETLQAFRAETIGKPVLQNPAVAGARAAVIEERLENFRARHLEPLYNSRPFNVLEVADADMDALPAANFRAKLDDFVDWRFFEGDANFAGLEKFEELKGELVRLLRDLHVMALMTTPAGEEYGLQAKETHYYIPSITNILDRIQSVNFGLEVSVKIGGSDFFIPGLVRTAWINAEEEAEFMRQMEEITPLLLEAIRKEGPVFTLTFWPMRNKASTAEAGARLSETDATSSLAVTLREKTQALQQALEEAGQSRPEETAVAANAFMRRYLSGGLERAFRREVSALLRSAAKSDGIPSKSSLEIALGRLGRLFDQNRANYTRYLGEATTVRYEALVGTMRQMLDYRNGTVSEPSQLSLFPSENDISKNAGSRAAAGERINRFLTGLNGIYGAYFNNGLPVLSTSSRRILEVTGSVETANAAQRLRKTYRDLFRGMTESAVYGDVVLAPDGEAVILVGYPGSGKTALSFAMNDRLGYGLGGAEMVRLLRISGRLYAAADHPATTVESRTMGDRPIARESHLAPLKAVIYIHAEPQITDSSVRFSLNLELFSPFFKMRWEGAGWKLRPDFEALRTGDLETVSFIEVEMTRDLRTAKYYEVAETLRGLLSGARVAQSKTLEEYFREDFQRMAGRLVISGQAIKAAAVPDASPYRDRVDTLFDNNMWFHIRSEINAQEKVSISLTVFPYGNLPVEALNGVSVRVLGAEKQVLAEAPVNAPVNATGKLFFDDLPFSDRYTFEVTASGSRAASIPKIQEAFDAIDFRKQLTTSDYRTAAFWVRFQLDRANQQLEKQAEIEAKKMVADAAVSAFSEIASRANLSYSRAQIVNFLDPQFTKKDGEEGSFNLMLAGKITGELSFESASDGDGQYVNLHSQSATLLEGILRSFISGTEDSDRIEKTGSRAAAPASEEVGRFFDEEFDEEGLRATRYGVAVIDELRRATRISEELKRVDPGLYQERLAIRQKLFDSLPKAAAGQTLNVISVGAGRGDLEADILEARPDIRLTAVDISAKNIERANRSLARYAEEGRFRALQADAHSLREVFREGEFDGILLIDTIAYLEERQALAELAVVAKPGATLLITGVPAEEMSERTMEATGERPKSDEVILGALRESGFGISDRGIERVPVEYEFQYQGKTSYVEASMLWVEAVRGESSVGSRAAVVIQEYLGPDFPFRKGQIVYVNDLGRDAEVLEVTTDARFGLKVTFRAEPALGSAPSTMSYLGPSVGQLTVKKETAVVESVIAEIEALNLSSPLESDAERNVRSLEFLNDSLIRNINASGLSPQEKMSVYMHFDFYSDARSHRIERKIAGFTMSRFNSFRIDRVDAVAAALGLQKTSSAPATKPAGESSTGSRAAIQEIRELPEGYKNVSLVLISRGMNFGNLSAVESLTSEIHKRFKGASVSLRVGRDLNSGEEALLRSVLPPGVDVQFYGTLEDLPETYPTPPDATIYYGYVSDNRTRLRPYAGEKISIGIPLGVVSQDTWAAGNDEMIGGRRHTALVIPTANFEVGAYYLLESWLYEESVKIDTMTKEEVLAERRAVLQSLSLSVAEQDLEAVWGYGYTQDYENLSRWLENAALFTASTGRDAVLFLAIGAETENASREAVLEFQARHPGAERVRVVLLPTGFDRKKDFRRLLLLSGGFSEGLPGLAVGFPNLVTGDMSFYEALSARRLFVHDNFNAAPYAAKPILNGLFTGFEPLKAFADKYNPGLERDDWRNLFTADPRISQAEFKAALEELFERHSLVDIVFELIQRRSVRDQADAPSGARAADNEFLGETVVRFSETFGARLAQTGISSAAEALTDRESLILFAMAFKGTRFKEADIYNFYFQQLNQNASIKVLQGDDGKVYLQFYSQMESSGRAEIFGIELDRDILDAADQRLREAAKQAVPTAAELAESALSRLEEAEASEIGRDTRMAARFIAPIMSGKIATLYNAYVPVELVWMTEKPLPEEDRQILRGWAETLQKLMGGTVRIEFALYGTELPPPAENHRRVLMSKLRQDVLDRAQGAGISPTPDTGDDALSSFFARAVFAVLVQRTDSSDAQRLRQLWETNRADATASWDAEGFKLLQSVPNGARISQYARLLFKIVPVEWKKAVRAIAEALKAVGAAA